MANPELVNYIKSYMGQGYNVEVIRNTLLQNGFTPQDIDAAMAEATAPTAAPGATVEHRISLSKSTILGLLVVLVFTGGLIFGVVKLVTPGAPETLLDLTLSGAPSEVAPGDTVEFTREITSMGRAARFDVVLRYEIVDTKTREVITRIEETEAVETKSSSRPQVKVPADALTGEYLLQATAFYQDLEASASFSFEVREEQEEIEVVADIPLSEEEPLAPGECRDCNDFDVCTTDTCVEGVCKNVEISPCCGDFKCQEGEDEDSCPDDCLKILGRGEAIAEIISQAKDLAEDDVVKGVRLCRSIQDTFKSDDCLLNVAKISKKSVLCGQVFEQRNKDKCYMDFAIKNEEFDLCPKIYDRWLKQSCISYSKISNVQFTDEQRQFAEQQIAANQA